MEDIDIGFRIKQLREQKNLSQEQLANLKETQSINITLNELATAAPQKNPAQQYSQVESLLDLLNK